MGQRGTGLGDGADGDGGVVTRGAGVFLYWLPLGGIEEPCVTGVSYVSTQFVRELK